MKFNNFFLFLWVIFALLDQDPATQIKARAEVNFTRGLLGAVCRGSVNISGGSGDLQS
jgi:hypothetical protein